jgi:hypothetical protein
MRLEPLCTFDERPLAGPVYRSILAVDLEGSTKRTNPAKGVLRRGLYQLMEHALAATGITGQHLEQPTDRGDGMLILIRPHDDVPKTALLGRLIPAMTTLLAQHNATVPDPSLRMRLRTVVHAGEIHQDDWGFYGEELDVAFRLLDSPAVKRALGSAHTSSLVLVISDEIFRAIVRHGYLDEEHYQPLVCVRVAGQRRRGWVCTPVPVDRGQSLTAPRPATALPSAELPLPTLAIAAAARYPARTQDGASRNATRPRLEVVRTP